MTSVLILQRLESVASASDHRHYLLLHQGTPRCTHKSPTSHPSVCRCTGSTVSLCGPQGSLVCFWHACRHRAAMQHGPEAGAAGLCPYSKCTFKYCNGVFATAQLGCSPCLQRETVLCLLPSPQTPPHIGTQYWGTESPPVPAVLSTPAFTTQEPSSSHRGAQLAGIRV